MSSVGAAGKVFEFLDRKPLISMEGKLKPDQLRGNVSFKHLNFAYPSCPSKSVLQVSSELQTRSDPSSRMDSLNMYLCSCTGLFFGAQVRSDDGPGGSIWRREDHLRESAGAPVRGAGGSYPIGRWAAEILRPPFPPPEGLFDHMWPLDFQSTGWSFLFPPHLRFELLAVSSCLKCYNRNMFAR